MIIVEGADNSGKTTIVNQIVERFGLRKLKSLGPKSNYDFWMGTLVDEKLSSADLIIDRFWFSELVYGPIFRYRTSTSTMQNSVIKSMLLTHQPLVIRCHLIENPDMYHNREQLFDWDMMRMVDKSYGDVIKQWGAGLRVVHYKWPSRTNIFPIVEEHLSTIGQWQERREQLSYGRGPLDASAVKYMVVGQSFAKNNPHQIPFEQSKTAVMLFSAAIKMRTYPGIAPEDYVTAENTWWTNAFKFEQALSTHNLDVLRREVDLLKPERIIALGSKASGMLSTLGVQHLSINHPGYHIRRGTPDQFAMQFTSAILGG